MRRTTFPPLKLGFNVSTLEEEEGQPSAAEIVLEDLDTEQIVLDEAEEEEPMLEEASDVEASDDEDAWMHEIWAEALSLEKILAVSPKRVRFEHEDVQYKYQSASYKTADAPLPLRRRPTRRTTGSLNSSTPCGASALKEPMLEDASDVQALNDEDAWMQKL